MCEDGWECESCTNAQGTFYKCTKVSAPDGYTIGLTECKESCQEYTYGGYTGNRVSGKCTPIDGYSASAPHCTSYIMLDYQYGISITGNTVKYLTRHDCYSNIVPLTTDDGEQYVSARPGANDNYCYTYDSKEGDDGVRCYANVFSVDDEYTSGERNTDSHIFDKKYGYDRGVSLLQPVKTCYKVQGCNTDNGWQPAEEVDAKKFVYDEVTQDNITCRKKTGCAEGYSESGDTCVKICTSNSDCARGEYCKITSYTTDGSCGSDYYTSVSGECADVGTATTRTINGVYTKYSSAGGFNWWSAYNWCEAQGLRLWTRDELSCSNLTGNKSGYCCLSGTSCSDDPLTHSLTMQALRGLYNTYEVQMWLNDNYPINAGPNSCYAFWYDTGIVGDYYRYNMGYGKNSSYAVCHGGCGAEYELDECPEGGICSKCSTDGTASAMKYKLDECEDGYKIDTFNTGCQIAATGCESCTSGKYCKITSYTTSGSCNTSNESYYTSLTGTCAALGRVKTTTINGVAITYNSFGVVNKFNWWSAYNWCAAQGKRLWTLDDLSCSNLPDPISTRYCCKSGTDCDDSTDTQSTMMQALRGLYRKVYWMWLNDSYGTNLGQNSCFAFTVYLGNGDMSFETRDDNNAGNAVCR